MKNRTRMRLAEGLRHCLKNNLGKEQTIEYLTEYAKVDRSTVEAYLQRREDREARVEADRQKALKRKKVIATGRKETTKKGRKVTMVKAEK